MLTVDFSDDAAGGTGCWMNGLCWWILRNVEGHIVGECKEFGGGNCEDKMAKFSASYVGVDGGHIAVRLGLGNAKAGIGWSAVDGSTGCDGGDGEILGYAGSAHFDG